MEPREGVEHGDLERDQTDQHDADDRGQRIGSVADPGRDIESGAALRTRRMVIHITH